MNKQPVFKKEKAVNAILYVASMTIGEFMEKPLARAKSTVGSGQMANWLEPSFWMPFVGRKDIAGKTFRAAL